MLRGLWQLTWIEIKIFLREPLGAVGSIVVPVLVFIVLGRVVGRRPLPAPEASGLIRVELPVFVTVLIALNAVLSLVTIIAIYREGGILKRLRATPLRPHTILAAHVKELDRQVLAGSDPDMDEEDPREPQGASGIQLKNGVRKCTLTPFFSQ